MNRSDIKSSDSKPRPKHPNQRQLSRFINGELSSENQAVMERHLERCTKCARRLEHIDGDTLGERLLEVGTLLNQSVAPGNQAIPESLRNHERYELIECIGAGGMGDVFRARQRSMDRPVAIKVLKQSLFENDRAVARFQNEIRVAAKLNHPNIVHSYDAEVSNGLNILVMELVEGEKLSDVVEREGTLGGDEAKEIAIQIVSGLEYASHQGMIHRDIKPQNIMLLPDGKVKVTDFGLAKLVLAQSEDAAGSLTLEGEVFGTPDYIAPEQIRDSASADFRSDIYGLGCTLYFLLSGTPPFAGMSVGEKLAGHLEHDAPSLIDVAPGLDPGMLAVVEKMMHKNPELRFQSYAELTRAFSGIGNPARKEETIVAQRKRSTGKIFAVIGGPIMVLLALWLFGLIPGMSSSQPLGDLPTGNIKFAIVVPSRFAFHPEIQEISRSLKRYQNVELEYVSDQAGRVKFSSRKKGAKPSVVEVTRTLGELDAADFDALVFTGGWNGDSPDSTLYAFDPKLNDQARDFARSMLANRKPVGSICGGTAVLANAGLLHGKKAASCRYISDAVRDRSGAIWTELPRRDDLAVVVRDDLLVTGGNYVNAPEVVRLMMDLAQESRGSATEENR
ncbi:protein kinase domain-containing protein [Mariniblastus fucicola]|nr:protein kinase [Mariniblastus fucicola]